MRRQEGVLRRGRKGGPARRTVERMAAEQRPAAVTSYPTQAYNFKFIEGGEEKSGAGGRHRALMQGQPLLSGGR